MDCRPSWDCRAFVHLAAERRPDRIRVERGSREPSRVVPARFGTGHQRRFEQLDERRLGIELPRRRVSKHWRTHPPLGKPGVHRRQKPARSPRCHSQAQSTTQLGDSRRGDRSTHSVLRTGIPDAGLSARPPVFLRGFSSDAQHVRRRRVTDSSLRQHLSPGLAHGEAGGPLRNAGACHLGRPSGIDSKLAKNCAITEQPAGTLLNDRKQRGLLDSTPVVRRVEFGWTPLGQLERVDEPAGCDRHADCFTVWVAGAFA